tara:strand:- start:507 stop:1976 length:1470 start_codon:yes stop_codon:yes gene_type:complete
MADKKISELDALSGSSVAADDLFVVVDTSAQVTKKISRDALVDGLLLDGFDATGSSTITTADNTTQLTLQSNDADASEGPRLDLRRNSASPADGDLIGTIRYLGEGSAGTNLVFAEIQAQLSDVTEGTADSSLDFFVRRDNALSRGLSLNPTNVIFNEDGNDIDFRVESDDQTNALFLNGNTSNFGINRSPTYELDVGANDTDGSVSGRIIAGTDSGASAIFRIHTQATSGARTSSLYFGDSANGGIGRIEYYHDDDSTRFNNNGSERMRITSGGLVGIGTAPSSGVQLDVRGTGVLQLVNTDTVQLLASSGGSTLKNVSNNPLIFGTNNTERMRILAGGGLTFNGETSTLNALNYYEEGNWTPTTSTNAGTPAVFGSASGKYTRIGRVVHISGIVNDVDTSGVTNVVNQFRIIGMPFTIDAQEANGAVSWNNIDGPYSQITAFGSTSEFIWFYASNNDGSNNRTPVDYQHMTSGTADIHFSITYFTDQ